MADESQLRVCYSHEVGPGLPTENVDAMVELWAALMRSDAMLSLLFYRAGYSIPWGEPGLPTRQEVSEVIGASRRLLGIP